MKPTFTNNKIIAGKEDKYLNVTVNAEKVVKSWKQSVFSFEWLDKNGKVKPAETMSESEKDKRQKVEGDLSNGAELETPILGIGLMENIEIGAGRAVFLTLYDNGETHIPVHIPKSNEDDFSKYLS